MGFWRAVDWQRPWLAPYRAAGQAAVAQLERGRDAAAALNALSSAAPIELQAGALRFVAHEALPAGEPYEAFIARTACVPTRDQLHDLFNGLVWLRFPRIKRRLNELQAQALAQDGVHGRRGALRDALTLFDENAVLWSPPPALAEALQQRDWTRLFVARRSEWADAVPVVFGHALLEKLVQPRKAITAHAWLLPPDLTPESAALAQLTVERLASKPWLPLPVAGVPDWWPGNASPDFYRDASIFRRPGR
jgi:hypothetical protein